jgi:hypothetical protein
VRSPYNKNSALKGSPQQPVPRIFISYRREDSSGYARLLFEKLEERFGPGNVFMDIDSVAPGVDFLEDINSNVSSCDILLALIGRNWLSSRDEEGRSRLGDPEDFVRLEISAALKKDIRVIPVLVGGGRMPRSQELPPELEQLATRQAFTLHDDGFRPRVELLIRQIEDAATVAGQKRELPKPLAEPKKKDKRGRPLKLAVVAAAALLLAVGAISGWLMLSRRFEPRMRRVAVL